MNKKPDTKFTLLAIGIAAAVVFVTQWLPLMKSKSPEPTPDQVAKMEIKAKRQELNGTKWHIVISELDSPDAKPKNDTLIFQNGQVKSEQFSEQGYNPTNYTVLMSESSALSSWETMQSVPTKGMMFWRGEWKEQTMNGRVNIKRPDGEIRKYVFSSTKMEEIASDAQPSVPAGGAKVGGAAK